MDCHVASLLAVTEGWFVAVVERCVAVAGVDDFQRSGGGVGTPWRYLGMGGMRVLGLDCDWPVLTGVFRHWPVLVNKE